MAKPYQRYSPDCYEGNPHYYYLWPDIPAVFRCDMAITWDCKTSTDQLTYDEYVAWNKQLGTPVEETYYYLHEDSGEVFETRLPLDDERLIRLTFHEYIDLSI